MIRRRYTKLLYTIMYVSPDTADMMADIDELHEDYLNTSFAVTPGDVTACLYTTIHLYKEVSASVSQGFVLIPDV